MIISTFRSNVSIVVPSTMDVSNACDNSTFVDNVVNLFSGYFGGATITPAMGAYLCDNGELVKEPVIVVSAFVADDCAEFAKGFVQSVAEQLCNDMRQECVMFTVDNVAYLVNGE